MSVIPIDIINKVEKEIENSFQEKIYSIDINECEAEIEKLIQTLHGAIDDKKRISYGITYVVKMLCKMIYQNADNPYEVGLHLYSNMKDFRSRCVGLGVVSYVGIDKPDEILPVLAEASTSEQWEIKEFVQMFVRKITKKHPEKVQKFLAELAKSDNADKRRFTSECLRPVAENRWIHDNPEFSLKVLRLLFTESDPFPRVSVGNNLSDLSRKHPELVFSIVEELMKMDNEHSEFIAHRACRNLVVKEPIRVMDILKIDEYKYKNKVCRRNE